MCVCVCVCVFVCVCMCICMYICVLYVTKYIALTSINIVFYINLYIIQDVYAVYSSLNLYK